MKRLGVTVIVLAAACGGGQKAGSAGGERPVARAPAEAYAGDGYGDVGYGGLAYGGWGYGGDPCDGDPCGMAMAPAPPDDPPALTSYLPPAGSVPGVDDPAAVYSVPLHDSPSLGPKSALVTVVTTFEFADPYSNRLRPTWIELATKYGAQVRFVWKHFIVHRDRAQASALAACAANRQGKFSRFFEAMYDSAYGSARPYRFDLTAVREIVGEIGLDRARFDADLSSQGCRDEVIRDQQLFEALGQGAVPITYINGRKVSGAQPTESFTKVIDEELAKAQAAVAKGARASTYYDGIVKAGKTKP